MREDQHPKKRIHLIHTNNSNEPPLHQPLFVHSNAIEGGVCSVFGTTVSKQKQKIKTKIWQKERKNIY